MLGDINLLIILCFRDTSVDCFSWIFPSNFLLLLGHGLLLSCQIRESRFGMPQGEGLGAERARPIHRGSIIIFQLLLTPCRNALPHVLMSPWVCY